MACTFLKLYLHKISAKIKIKHRGSYIRAHVLLNLSNELGQGDKIRGLPSILSLFRNEFNKFNKKISTNVRFYLSYDIKITLKSHSAVKMLKFCHYARNVVMDVIKLPENL